MRRIIPAALLLLACAACAACASAPAPAGEGGRPGAEARPPSRAANRITRAEIEESSYRDAYALVEATRPRWLRGQTGSERVGRVVVEIGSVVAGGVDMLRQISLDTVESLEFNDSFDVTQGGAASGQYAGTIRVVLRTRR